jgi:hypothetical protein
MDAGSVPGVGFLLYAQRERMVISGPPMWTAAETMTA